MPNTKIINSKLLPSRSVHKYSGLTTDGKYIYILNTSQDFIDQYDLEFNYIFTYPTQNIYIKMCYDSCECCFWAISTSPKNKIFKLNAFFEEIDFIELNCLGKEVSNIDYDCKSDHLLVTVCNEVFCLSKCDKSKHLFYSFEKNKKAVGINPLFPYLILGYNVSNNYFIDFVTKRTDQSNIIPLPNHYKLVDFFFFPCSFINEYLLYLLVYQNNNQPMLLTMRLDFPCDHFTYDTCYDYVYYDNCNHNHICPQTAITYILESVANVEYALAHILNAEGEKIQHIIKESDCIHDILAVNDSVTKTLIHATHLEQALFEKLELVKQINYDFICCPPCLTSDCYDDSHVDYPQTSVTKYSLNDSVKYDSFPSDEHMLVERIKVHSLHNNINHTENVNVTVHAFHPDVKTTEKSVHCLSYDYLNDSDK